MQKVPMTTVRSFFRATMPTLGLLTLLAVPSAFLTGVEGDALPQPAPATKTYFMENCAVCKKSMKDGTDHKAVVEGREMHTCTDKCAADMAARPEYYKGVYDGVDRSHQSHIGPKGGDTIKGPHPGKK